MGFKVRIGPLKVKTAAWFGLLTCSLVVFLPSYVMGAFESVPGGPRDAGLAQAGVALEGDVWGLLRNPAIAPLGRMQFGAGWSQQFDLPELTRESALLASEIGQQFLAISAESFGSSLYRESSAKGMISRRFSSKLSVGAELNGQFLAVKQYGRGSAFGSAVGMILDAHRDVRLGAVWRNPGRPAISHFRERLPESLTIGLTTNASSRAVVCADVIQEHNFPMEVRIGAEVVLHPSIAMRVGARGEPFRPAGGFSLKLKRWTFHYSGDLHQELGPSHAVGLELQMQ